VTTPRIYLATRLEYVDVLHAMIEVATHEDWVANAQRRRSRYEQLRDKHQRLSNLMAKLTQFEKGGQ
jgi:hypothetical protein